MSDTGCSPGCACGPTCGCRSRRGVGGVVVRALALCGVAGALGMVDLARRPFTLIDRAELREVPHAAAGPSVAPGTAAGGTAPSHGAAPAGVSFVGLERTFELFERGRANGDAAFVDARPKDEFDAAHVPLAFHMPLDAFFGGKVPADLEMIPRASAVVVYCGGGDCDASIRVSERLRDLGYGEIYIFEAGFPVWAAAGKPVEGSTPAHGGLR